MGTAGEECATGFAVQWSQRTVARAAYNRSQSNRSLIWLQTGETSSDFTVHSGAGAEWPLAEAAAEHGGQPQLPPSLQPTADRSFGAPCYERQLGAINGR